MKMLRPLEVCLYFLLTFYIFIPIAIVYIICLLFSASGANIDSKRDPISLKENVLNLKSDKPRKKHLRFNGMSEEEVAKRQLPDLLKENLDILIVSSIQGLPHGYGRFYLVKISSL